MEQLLNLQGVGRSRKQGMTDCSGDAAEMQPAREGSVRMWLRFLNYLW